MAVEMSKAMATRGSTGIEGNVGAKNQETKITRQRPHYGLPETITAVMPSHFYISAFVPGDRNDYTAFQLRLTSMLDQMVTSVTNPVGGAAYTPGIFSAVAPTSNQSSWPSTIVNPTYSGLADSSQWRAYYHKVYQYYRVLGIEWELTIQNAQHNVGNDLLFFTYIDTFSSSNSTNVHPNNAKVGEIMYWPDVRWHVVRSNQDGSGEHTWSTIKGYYYPGRVKQNVENDEDVKTWSKVGTSPALSEMLTVGVAKTPFNTTSATAVHGCNIRVSMRKIVQYKDLQPAFRWPAAAQTDIVLTVPDDILPNA